MKYGNAKRNGIYLKFRNKYIKYNISNDLNYNKKSCLSFLINENDKFWILYKNIIEKILKLCGHYIQNNNKNISYLTHIKFDNIIKNNMKNDFKSIIYLPSYYPFQKNIIPILNKIELPLCYEKKIKNTNYKINTQKINIICNCLYSKYKYEIRKINEMKMKDKDNINNIKLQKRKINVLKFKNILHRKKMKNITLHELSKVIHPKTLIKSCILKIDTVYIWEYGVKIKMNVIGLLYDNKKPMSYINKENEIIMKAFSLNISNGISDKDLDMLKDSFNF